MSRSRNLLIRMVGLAALAVLAISASVMMAAPSFAQAAQGTYVRAAVTDVEQAQRLQSHTSADAPGKVYVNSSFVFCPRCVNTNAELIRASLESAKGASPTCALTVGAQSLAKRIGRAWGQIGVKVMDGLGGNLSCKVAKQWVKLGYHIWAIRNNGKVNNYWFQIGSRYALEAGCWWQIRINRQQIFWVSWVNNKFFSCTRMG